MRANNFKNDNYNFIKYSSLILGNRIRWVDKVTNVESIMEKIPARNCERHLKKNWEISGDG